MAPTLSENPSRIAPERARHALQQLAAGSASEAVRRQAEAELGAVLDELEEGRSRPHTGQVDCPACASTAISAPFAGEHLRLCRRHPAVVRFDSLRTALAHAPAIAAALGFAPTALELPSAPDLPAGRDGVRARGHRWVTSSGMLRAHLSFLAGPKRSEYPTLVPSYCEELQDAVETWERIFHRASDPCPFCGALTSLEEVIPHLLACERHPAALAAAPAESALVALLGRAGADVLLAQILEHDRSLQGLRTLVAACDRFDSDLGWNDGHAYARDYVERDLGRARHAAEQFVGVEPPEHTPSFDPEKEAVSGPEFARPVWQALLRVREEGPTPGSHGGRESDAALLRETVAEALRLLESPGESTTCPACARPGLPLHRAAEHLRSCPCHPAELRAQAAAARLALANAVLREKRPGVAIVEVREEKAAPVRLFWPSTDEHTGPGLSPRWRHYYEGEAHKLIHLLTPAERQRYPRIVKSYAEDVARLLSGWQRSRLAAKGACPHCVEEMEVDALLAHELRCAGHPAVAQGAACEEALLRLGASALELPGRLRREAIVARLATARLLEFTQRFCSSFGDDERGRAIVYSWLAPAWNRERQLARETLARSPQSPLKPQAPAQQEPRTERWTLVQITDGNGKVVYRRDRPVNRDP